MTRMQWQPPSIGLLSWRHPAKTSIFHNKNITNARCQTFRPAPLRVLTFLGPGYLASVGEATRNTSHGQNQSAPFGGHSKLPQNTPFYSRAELDPHPAILQSLEYNMTFCSSSPGADCWMNGRILSISMARYFRATINWS